MTGIKATVALDGDKELKQLLHELPRRVVKGALRRSINLGCSPIVKAAKKGAPKRYGFLRKAIAKRIKTYPSGNVAGVIGAKKEVQGTGPGSGKKTGKIIPYFYFHLVEGGTSHSQADPFLERAFDGQKGNALGIARTTLTETLEKEAMKLGKK